MKNVFLTAALITSVAPIAFASTDSTSIDIEANIPSSSFYVRPTEGISGPVTMNYDLASQSLENAEIQLSYKKPAADKVTAKLKTEPTLFNGASIIDLDVEIESVAMTTTASDVVAKDDGDTGTLALVIKPGAVAADDAGLFKGQVELEFEAVLVE